MQKIKKKQNIIYFLKNIKCFYCLDGHEYKNKIFKEEESIKILRSLGLTNNIKE